MTTTATLVYKAYKGGSLSLSNLNILMSAVPTPDDIFTFLGCRVTSDVTIDGPPVQRTIVVSLVPSADAVAVAHVEPSDVSGSKVVSVSVSSAGADYVLPPVVVFSGGRVVEQVAVLDNDKLSPTAAAQAYLQIGAITINHTGSLYSAGTTIQVVGGLPNGRGRLAVLTPTIDGGGHITAVVITDPGEGYTTAPKLVVVDSVGSGAELVAGMSVGKIVVTRGGEGYIAAPAVTLVPAFKAMFPDTVGAQAGAFANLMTSELAKATSGPVDAEPPLIA